MAEMDKVNLAPKYGYCPSCGLIHDWTKARRRGNEKERYLECMVTDEQVKLGDIKWEKAE